MLKSGGLINALLYTQANDFKPLNNVNMLNGTEKMQYKWQLLLFLGQQTILNMQTAT